MTQYLSATFRLRLTKRKAAALARVQAKVDDSYWERMTAFEEATIEISGISVKRERSVRLAGLLANLKPTLVARGICHAVSDGLLRDIEQSLSSFIELKVGGFSPSYPSRPTSAPSLDEGIDALAAAVDDSTYAEARDLIGRASKQRQPSVRPITLNRRVDGLLVKDSEGRFAVALNVLIPSAEKKMGKGRKSLRRAGFDPNTGEPIEAFRSERYILAPVEMSQWHQDKFLKPNMRLRSSLVFERGGHWFMVAQFEVQVAKAAMTGACLGIDRGVVHPVSASVVSDGGVVLEVGQPAGPEIGERIGWALRRRRWEQRRRGQASSRHLEFVDHALHRLTNDIVASALKHGAEVAIEALDGLKSTITTPRPKGTRKHGWRTVLKRAQLGKIEQMLAYKLALAGLPRLREVLAGGTSNTCSNCGYQHKKNRLDRGTFKCLACGHEDHADLNASVVIARRGVLMRNVKKGQKLIELHKNMVDDLRKAEMHSDSPVSNGGGLGPVGDFSGGVVQVLGSAAGDSGSLACQTPSPVAGQKLLNAPKTDPRGPYSHSVAPHPRRHRRQKRVADQSVARTQLELPFG